MHFEAERIKDRSDDFDRQFDDVKKETIKVWNDYESSQSTIKRLDMELSQLSKSNEILKEEKRSLENALERCKVDRNELEKESRRYKMEMEGAQESLWIMQQEHKMLSDDLTDKMNELHSVEKKRTDLERKLIESNSYRDKLDGLEKHVEEVVRKKSKSDQEAMKYKTQVHDLESDLASKQRALADAEERYDTLRESLKARERDNYKLESTTRAKMEVDRENDDLHTWIGDLQSDIRRMVQKEEELRGMLREKEREVDAEREKVNMANDANDKMKSDIKHLRE